MSKVCTKCNIEKTIDEYRAYKNRKKNILYRGDCKVCQKQYIKQYMKQYRKKNKKQEQLNSKVCIRCNIEKPIDEYPKSGKKKNGDIKYRGECKTCKNQYSKQLKEKYKKQVSVQQVQLNSKVCTKCDMEKTIDDSRKEGIDTNSDIR